MQTYVQLELCHPNQHGDSHLLRIGFARHHFGRCEQECTEQRRDHLAINGEYGDYTIATSATYFCGCSNLNLGVGSGRVVPVPPPNYTVNLVQDSGTYIFTTNPLRHRKDVWYQLFNNGTPFAGGGVVTESFAVIQNPCGLGIATGTASLDGSGMFPDTYYNDTRMCSDGCFLTSKQTYRFDSRNIRDNRVEFFCANIKVQQW